MHLKFNSKLKYHFKKLCIETSVSKLNFITPFIDRKIDLGKTMNLRANLYRLLKNFTLHVYYRLARLLFSGEAWRATDFLRTNKRGG